MPAIPSKTSNSNESQDLPPLRYFHCPCRSKGSPMHAFKAFLSRSSGFSMTSSSARRIRLEKASNPEQNLKLQRKPRPTAIEILSLSLSLQSKPNARLQHILVTFERFGNDIVFSKKDTVRQGRAKPQTPTKAKTYRHYDIFIVLVA